MTAIRVAQLARLIVVFSEEDRCVVALGGILVKQVIHRSQKSLRLFPSGRALAAQIRLEICHQQSGCHAFSRDIANHQAESSLTEIQKIVIIAADGAGGAAKATIGESLKGRMPLREEA